MISHHILRTVKTYFIEKYHKHISNDFCIYNCALCLCDPSRGGGVGVVLRFCGNFELMKFCQNFGENFGETFGHSGKFNPPSPKK